MARSRKTRRRTVIVQEGRSVSGESVTAEGAPGESVDTQGGGRAQGGAGASASAKGGSATARSVKIQTTDEPG
jgi:hypothetical protein